MKLGFIGTGKIASAVIEGICSSEIGDAMIRISPRNEGRSLNLSQKYTNVMRMEGNQGVVDESDCIFLALQPSQAAEILSDLHFREDQTVVSLIPLIRQTDLSRIVSPAGNVCRAIPLPTVVNHNCPIPVFNATDKVINIFKNIGQPLIVDNENQLHTLWTLTCLITPFYDLLNELSIWTVEHGVDKAIANQYIANLFQSLAHTAQVADPIDFGMLALHAATPNGMNEQAGLEIRARGAHTSYREAAEKILARFPTSMISMF